MSGTETRQQLIDAALRAFAERGVRSASLLEITRLAEQRNRGAVHYHFGSRDALLAAALEQQSARLRDREVELLEAAAARPDDDLAAAVEALVRPAAEHARSGWRGRCYVIILVDLLTYPSAELDPAVAAALARPESHDIGDLIARRLPSMDEETRTARIGLIMPFVLRAIAEWARNADDPDADAARLPGTERFVIGLVGLCTEMLLSPVPPA